MERRTPIPMPTHLPLPKRRTFFNARMLFYLACAGAAAVALHASFRDQYGEIFAPLTTGTVAAKPDPGAPRLPTVVKLDTARPSTPAGPKIIDLAANPVGPPVGAVQPGRIRVVDADTIHIDGQPYRLVGFDTPESGQRAKCAVERELAARATRRLRQIVAGGGLKFQRVPCGCPVGAEGTDKCNHGRLCAVLTAADRDIGLILVGEGLARRYSCVAAHCPPKQPWCT
jgi:endonuclease YncB( thermonuclease family)